MTQTERVLNYLNDYGSITALDAMREFGIMRLTSRIWDLKQAGYRIKTETVKGKNRYGETTHFSKYSLEESEK